MTTMTDEIVVTAAQIALYAAHVNDRRVIVETREMVEAAGVNPDLVTRMAFTRLAHPRLPKMTFTVFRTSEMVDEETGETSVARVREFNDGTAFDEEFAEAGKPWHYVTDDVELKFRGTLPGWWTQAARVVVPDLKESE